MIARKCMVKMVAIICGLLLGTLQQATAGEWLFKPGLDGGPHLWEYKHDDSDYSHLSDTAPATPHPRNVPYSVTISNATQRTVIYTMNDKSEVEIKPGHTGKWTVKGSKENPAVFKVSFDNGQQKEIEHKLENNATYKFEDKAKGIDLYKKK